MRSRFIEFFEDEDNQLSMSRLLCFMSFFPATLVVILTLSVDALGWYLGAFVVGYVGGKGADAISSRKTRKYDSTDS
jgi:hypothetical protein